MRVDSQRLHWLAVRMATILLALTACTPADPIGTGPTDPPRTPSRVVTTADVVSGEGQWALEQTPLRDPIRLQLRNADGDLVPLKAAQVSVHFGDGSLAAATATSDSAGMLVLPGWTLGAASLDQRVRIRVDSVDKLIAAYAFNAPPAGLGERLYVLTGDALLRVPATGVPQLVQRLSSRPTDAAISVGDSLIAFTDGETDSLCVGALWGPQRRCARPGTLGRFLELSWSTDRSRLAAVGHQEVLGGFGLCFCNPPLPVSIDLQTLRPTVVNRPVEAATWSPDESMIAFRRGDELWLMDADGTHARQVPLPAGIWADRVAWSADGSRFALVFRIADACAFLCDTGIGVMNVDGSEFRSIATARTSDEQYLSRPVWSPDGTRIAFVRETLDTASGLYVSDTYRVPSAGGAAELLAPRSIPIAWR